MRGVVFTFKGLSKNGEYYLLDAMTTCDAEIVTD